MFQAEVAAFCAMQTSPRTQTEYRKDLERWFGASLPLTVDGAAKYKTMLTEKYTAATAGRFWSTVRTFHKWLVTRGLLEHSPFEAIKAPSRRHLPVVESPSDNVVDALVAFCTSPRDRLVVLLLLQGLRASEVSNLPADALRFTAGYGHWLVVLGKGDKERIVPVSDEIVDAVNALGNEGSDWLVHNPDGSRVTYDAVNGLIDTAAKKAKVKVYPHMLRHHYGTRMVRAGANVFVLQKLLGHSTVATTQRYVSMDLTDLVEASRLDPRNNGGIRIVPSHLEDHSRTGTDAGHRPSLRVASA